MNEKTSWDKAVAACYDKNLCFTETVMRVIYSDAKTNRAVLLQRPDGFIHLVFEKLVFFDDDELLYPGTDMLPGYWYSCSHSYSVFDTVERAAHAVFSEVPFKTT